ncbi:hypothetical protein CTI12_AA488830 [Artemisia annua]|uniref:Retrotransposon gag domain-containing protein n=1 Tax=Artemisia annua TaxID=35608 RepID=A0A2U1LHJ6_ARTAN|nr:hypothetical protein CTI12_AA488830 [Artemisia annua]
MNNNNQNEDPPGGPQPPPDLRTMEELCQPTMFGYGGPIAPVNIEEADFGLKHHMIQQVQNFCQFHGLPGDDANKHLDKFLTITQSMKQNGVTDDALRLSLFPFSLTHHATAWFDRLPKNSIHLRNDISNFRQLPDESLFEAWERYKLSIDRCPNHNMLLVTIIDTFYNGLTLRHRDTINAAAGGTFMKRCPEECYDLIENMTTHHNYWDSSAERDESLRSTTSSNAEIAALNKKFDEVLRVFTNQNHNNNRQVNVINQSCETCGGPHTYFECPATGAFAHENVHATNTGGNGYQPQGDRNLLSYRSNNYLGPPPGFNNQLQNQIVPHRNNFVNQNQNRPNHGFHNQNQGFHQNRGFQTQGNHNQGPIQGNLQNANQRDFQNVNNGNQNHGTFQNHNNGFHNNNRGQNFNNQNQVVNQNQTSSDEMLKQFMQKQEEMNKMLINQMAEFNKRLNDRPSGSGTTSLPSNTIANPRGDVKAITTRSGVSYDGPTAPTTLSSSSPPKVVARETEATTDTELPINNGRTENIQPPVVHPSKSKEVEPEVAPVETPKSNPKPSIPYPSRLNDHKLREKANHQLEKFHQILQDLHFDISFTDAILLMPKFASTIKNLVNNKEKLHELAKTSLNEHCSAVILKKLPEKLGDPDKFLIPCNFPGMVECFALADLGASINLMPKSVWQKLSLPELTPTCMTLELADRSITRPIGIAEDVFVKVGKFHFPADFVIVDFDADPRVPLILGERLPKDRSCFD